MYLVVCDAVLVIIIITILPHYILRDDNDDVATQDSQNDAELAKNSETESTCSQNSESASLQARLAAIPIILWMYELYEISMLGGMYYYILDCLDNIS